MKKVKYLLLIFGISFRL